jgi:hypothetical protein
MSFIVLIGLIGVLLVILFKSQVIGLLGGNNTMVYKLSSAKWFQNHWISGIFLFVMNVVLFFFTGFVLYVLTYFSIPFVHILVMFLAVVSSIFLWTLMNRAWQGTKSDRLKMGAIGSSFYILLTVMLIYWIARLEPSYPGEDTFMGAIVLLFAIIVTTVAFITCFVITGFSKKENCD